LNSSCDSLFRSRRAVWTPRPAACPSYVLLALVGRRPARLTDKSAAGLPDGPREPEALAGGRLAQAGHVALALGHGHLERTALGVLRVVRAAPDVGLRDRDQHWRWVGGAKAAAAEPAIPLLRAADHVRAAFVGLDACAGLRERRQHGVAVTGAERAEHPALLVDDRQHRVPA